MVKPEDGSVYLATEQEIKDKDLPIHISIINLGDPELAAELKAKNIEYVTMSGKGITTTARKSSSPRRIRPQRKRRRPPRNPRR